MRTRFTGVFDGSEAICTDLAQIPKHPPRSQVTFPVAIKHRSGKAKIYAPAKNFEYYRVSYFTGGKRRMVIFASYGEARKGAKKIAKDLHKGSQAAALTAGQSRDALAAFERLEELHRATGRRVSLFAAVLEFAKTTTKIHPRTAANLSGSIPCQP
jgi:hypothetical protein